MEKKIQIGLIFLIICIIFISLVVFYLNRERKINPPETLKFDILIDLESPDAGTIYIMYPENKVSRDDYDIVVAANRNAWDILDQYSIPYQDPYSIKPNREIGIATVSLNFFAETKSEFVGPIYTFKSTSWVPFYEEANVTIILPKGYEPIEKIPSRSYVFEGGRWKYVALVREFEKFNLELEYTKSEIYGSEN